MSEQRIPKKNIDGLRPEEMTPLFGTIHGTLKIPFPANTLTIAMIVKNEAKNIREAIESFRPIADEIVVFDTGSTDGTQEILTELKIKWKQGEWKNNFSWARNQSIELAKCSWVLWMDADDRLPPDQIENFLKLKKAPLDRAFGFQVINTQGGLPYGGRFMQLRMFPNHPRIRFRFRIHEQMLHGIAKLGLHLFYTETTIYHTGYESSDLKKSKAKRNLELLKNETERIETEPALSMSVGDSYYIIEDYANGIEAYKKTMAMPNCEAINCDIYRELPSCIGQGYQRLGKKEEAITWFDQSIAMQPWKHEPYYYKAECLTELGRIEDAEIIYEKLVEMPVSLTTTSNQYDIIQIYSHYHLGEFYSGRGDFVGASQWLKKLNTKYPQVVEGWQLLGNCELSLGNREECLKHWTRALELNPTASQDLHRRRLVLLKHLNEKQKYIDAVLFAKKYFPTIQYSEWSGRPNLSLCMIVKNEKTNLGACLNSAKDLADEIIIVDTGSTDGTQDIARSFGATVIQSEWKNDFSLARNDSISAAKGKWIIWLDADDRILETDKLALKKLTEQDPDIHPKAYGILIKNTQDNGLTGSVFNQIRIFPNRPELRFRAPVHEQILPAIEEQNIPVEYKNIKILHTGYTDTETSKAKQIRNKNILETQIESGLGLTAVTYYTLANACFDLEFFSEAENCYVKAGEEARRTNSNPHIAASVNAKRAAALAAQKKYNEALLELQNELSTQNPSVEAMLVKAQVEQALNHADLAKPWYEKLLSQKETNSFIPVDFQIIKIKSLQFLGQYWFEHNQRDLAVSMLKAGLAIKQGIDFSNVDLEKAYRYAHVT